MSTLPQVDPRGRSAGTAMWWAGHHQQNPAIFATLLRGDVPHPRDLHVAALPAVKLEEPARRRLQLRIRPARQVVTEHQMKERAQAIPPGEHARDGKAPPLPGGRRRLEPFLTAAAARQRAHVRVTDSHREVASRAAALVLPWRRRRRHIKLTAAIRGSGQHDGATQALDRLIPLIGADPQPPTAVWTIKVECLRRVRVIDLCASHPRSVARRSAATEENSELPQWPRSKLLRAHRLTIEHVVAG